uniref:Uncharacterized protein n=1 Tax=Tanacetum cinerariifolium TaxID=118510 RepID=A0A6L2P4F9_TANCI|nr:hypothetical protein [Tanacetum cinerariifolium]
MAQSLNVSSLVVQDVVNGHVSHLPNGHVLGMPNRHVSEYPNGHNSQLLNGNGVQLASVNVAQFPDEHVPQLSRIRLLTVLYQEVSAGLSKVDRFHKLLRDHLRSVRRLAILIAKFRDDEDLVDGDAILGLLERLRLDNLEKAVRFLLMIKEVKLKIAEKNICIGRLRRNGAVVVKLLVEAALKYVHGNGFLGVFDNSSKNLLSTAKLVLDLIWSIEFKIAYDNRSMSRCLISGFGISDAAHIQSGVPFSCFYLNWLGNRHVGMADWEPQFILRCNREKLEDVRLARDINTLCMCVSAIVDERVNFVNELDMLEPKLVSRKMA